MDGGVLYPRRHLRHGGTDLRVLRVGRAAAVECARAGDQGGTAFERGERGKGYCVDTTIFALAWLWRVKPEQCLIGIIQRILSEICEIHTILFYSRLSIN